jgi:CRISPR-associated endoribonuclease Cas6
MIRLYIDLPKTYRHAVIKDRDQVANTLVAALKKHGWRPNEKQPARWGFGVVAKRLNAKSDNPKQWLHKVERIIVGSNEAETAAALAQLTPSDLLEDNQVDGAGLDLSMAAIDAAPDWQDTEAVNVYCVSPLRVSDPANRKLSLLQTGDAFNQALNQTMQTRFGRPFDLRLTPDSLYVRVKSGDIAAGMAIKTLDNGKPVIVRGIVLPFLLTGSAEDIRDAWYCGLGRSTARGFGCLEVAE